MRAVRLASGGKPYHVTLAHPTMSSAATAATQRSASALKSQSHSDPTLYISSVILYTKYTRWRQNDCNVYAYMDSRTALLQVAPPCGNSGEWCGHLPTPRGEAIWAFDYVDVGFISSMDVMIKLQREPI